MTTPTLDRLSRPLADLRVSVTDRCNLRCPYCLPREAFGRGFSFMPSSELLSFEEIAIVAGCFARLGVSKIRLTGGEPLLRRQLERLVAMLVAIDGIEEVALTTNGILLADQASALKDAGLNRVTVSLDALDEKVAEEMSDARLPLDRVLAGIEAAADAGLGPLKVNMVVRRGVNDHCVLAMAERFRGSRVTLRFIEYMDVGTSNGWRRAEVVPAAELRAAIARRWPLDPLAPTRPGEVASRWRYRDGAGEVGFIHSITEPFCATCTRARMSAEGKLYTCLFATDGLDLRALLRAGIGERALQERLRETWGARTDRYSAERLRRDEAAEGEQDARGAPSSPRIEMSYIGG